jgi:hypothetical protein
VFSNNIHSPYGYRRASSPLNVDRGGTCSNVSAPYAPQTLQVPMTGFEDTGQAR